jgi:uncharacterized protein (UPF0335 family)
MIPYRLTIILLIATFVSAASAAAKSQEMDSSPNDQTLLELQRIAELETLVFDRRLSDDELNAELVSFANHRQTKRRRSALKELVEIAQGCQDEIAAFANSSTDIEIRELCAELIAELDSNWQKRKGAEEWLALVNRQNQTIFGDAWQRVVEDSTDRAAVEIVLNAPPEKAWKWIADYNKANEFVLLPGRTTPLRRGTGSIEYSTLNERSIYVFLRIRERSPDAFAAEKLPGCWIRPQTISPIFPLNVSRSNHAYRSVGHVMLNRLATNPARGKPIPTFVDPRKMREKFLKNANTVKQTLELHPISHRLFTFESPSRTSRPNVPKVKYEQLISQKSVRYGPWKAPRPGTKSDKKTPSRPARVKTDDYLYADRVQVKHFTPYVPIVDLTSDENRRDFHLTNSGRTKIPWWWEAYTPEALAEQITFLPRDRGSEPPPELSRGAPKGIAPTGKPSEAPAADRDSPSFVMLPALLARKKRSDRDLAELASERIAEEIQNQTAQVVDRSLLAQIFQERKRNKNSQPLTGFDVLTRLRVTNDQRNRFVKLSFVDLSTGTVIEGEQLVWPVPDSAIPRIQKMIKASIETIKIGRKGKINVRLRFTQLPNDARIRPTSRKIVDTLERALRRDPTIRLVEHIESDSSVEEAFLLMTELSQLPGGRTFQPAADVTIEASLAEKDAIGKTFAERELSLSLNFKIAGEGIEETQSVAGKLIDVESDLIPRAFKLLKRQLDSVQSDSVAKVQHWRERGQQSKEELQRQAAIDPTLPIVDQAEELQKRALRALKLDPNSKEALFELVVARGLFLKNCRRDDSRRLRIYAGAVKNILAMELDFGIKHSRFEDFRDAVYAVHRRALDAPGISNKDRRKVRRICLAIAAQDLSGSIRSLSELTPKIVSDAIDQMMYVETAEDNFRGQLKTFVSELKRLEKETKQIVGSSNDLTSRETSRFSTILNKKLVTLRRELLVACSDLKMNAEYDMLWEQVLLDLGDADDVAFLLLRSDVNSLGDKKRRATLMAAIAEAKKRRDANELARKKDLIRKRKARKKEYVSYPRWRWPTTKPSPVENLDPVKEGEVPLKFANGDAPAFKNVCPIAKTKNRLFFETSPANRFGFESFRRPNFEMGSASDQRQIGFIKIEKDGSFGSAELIDMPKDMPALKIQGAAAFGQWLLLGTNGDHLSKTQGLYLYSIKNKTWKFIGRELGLSVQWITGMHDLGEGRILCTGGNRRVSGNRPGDVWFVFDFKQLDVLDFSDASLASSLNGNKLNGQFLDVWNSNGTVEAFSEFYHWRNLLSQQPTTTKPSGPRDEIPNARFYQNAYTACLHSGYVFYQNGFGLHRMDSNNRVTRFWRINLNPSAWPLTRRNFQPYLASQSELPCSGRVHLVSCGPLVLMFPSVGNSVLGYDPSIDTWYGPIKTQRSVFALPDGDQIWLGGSSIRQLSMKALIENAESQNRVFTSAEMQTSLMTSFESKPTLHQAMHAFGQEKFDQSLTKSEEVLADDPENWRAWILKGLLNDQFALHRMDESAKAYRMAEKVANSDSERYGAAVLQVEMYLRNERRDLAATAAKRLLEEFSNIAPRSKQQFQLIADQAENE